MRLLTVFFILVLALPAQVLSDDASIIFNTGVFDISHNDCQGDCDQNFDSSGAGLGMSMEWYTAKSNRAQLGLNLSVFTSIKSPYYSRLSAAVLVKKSISRFPVFAGIGVLDASSTIDSGSGIGATSWREHYQLPFIMLGIDYPIQSGHIRLSGTMLSGRAGATGVEITGFDALGNPILSDLARESSIRTSTIMIGFVLPM